VRFEEAGTVMLASCCDQGDEPGFNLHIEARPRTLLFYRAHRLAGIQADKFYGRTVTLPLPA
jgi:hypothetical protein